MSKEIYISSTPHETRLAIVESDELAEIYYERENEYTLAGSIYNGKVTRVLPGMQSSFVDIGLERDAFLYITDFMEEAGDTADFDSGDGAQRGRGREHGGEGGSRPGDVREDRRSEDRRRDGNRIAADPAAVPAENDVPRLAQPLGEGRSERGGEPRGDRRGRRRPDGRDDRSGNRERDDRSRNRDRRPNGIASDAAPATPLVPSFSPEPAGLDLTGDAAAGPTDIGSLGEGAMGADGSRRWRGRRGRRRGGRAPNVIAGQESQNDGSSESGEFAPAGTLVNEPGGFDPGYNLSTSADAFDTTEAEAEGTFDIDAQAEIALRLDQEAGGADASATTQSSVAPRGERSRAGDRDRSGDRGRDAGRGDRGGDRGDRSRRAPRAPRGFAPSRALYGVEATPPLDEANGDEQPFAEPIVMPGESLSKYRTRTPEEAAVSSAAASPAGTPAPDFNLAGAWDGGAVLPGESLQRRSRGPSASPLPPRPEGRFDTRSRPSRVSEARVPEARVPEATAPDEPSFQQAVDLPSTPPTPTTTTETLAAVDPAPAPAADLKRLGTSALEADAEYEPIDASASLRFDPNPPSTYRQSAAVMDEAPRIEDASPAPTESARSESAKAEPTAADDTPSIAHSITPQPAVPLAPIQVTATDFDAPSSHAGFTTLPEAEPPVELFPDHNSERPEHEPEQDSQPEYTRVSPEGEMLSETFSPPPAPELPHPSAPIHHETAILGAAADEADGTDEEDLDANLPESSPSNADLRFFAPGDGALEEEVMEDEEFDAPTLQASAAHDPAYEEETLEGVADLGTMIRELSIDQITSAPEPGELDDDEILEEEDAAHDRLYVEAEDFESARFAAADPAVSDDDLIAADLTDTSEASFGAVADEAEPSTSERDRNDRGRRDSGRRDGRDRGRDRSRSSSGGSSSTERTSRPGRRDGRHSMQTTNLPAISDLLKPGQEVLVQIAKEPIAKKGARITSHIALPGRFLVFMPTVHHTGVSRKIESDGERRRLKEILLSEKGDAAGGFIVRTAAAGASEEELRSDLRFLLNLWADIKQRSESSKSPALIYHDLNLVERILRDQVTDTFSAIWVDTEDAYERVLRFLQRFQPSLIRRVKLYSKDTPLFEQFGITEEINKALRSKVWLKSGGSIVINQTEALVAIDINTGKYVGKTARLEDTIVKTNLDAIPEIVRQIRLRDLGGIIIIDFIDMDERKNRNRVMAALEDELKKDRAPSKVLQFNDFGLVAITRKRVKQSLERTLSSTCAVCQGTGMTKSPVTVCNDIFVEMRKMQKHLDRGDVMLRVNPEVVKQLKSPGTRWLQEMEELVGKTILVKSDPALHPEQFDIH